MSSVYEDPNGLNYQTSYTYDLLDNLITVNQGVQTRSFVYDSLKRLTSATNPESGTTSYTYDNNGNLLTKTDARNIVTTIAYDALNRPTLKTYQNDGGITPAVAYFYDNQTLPGGAPTFSRGYSTGRLVAVTYGGTSGGDYFGVDALGRSLLKIQQTGSVNYQTSAIYNVSGAITTETYPSGRVVNYGYDTAGRASTVAGNLGDGTPRTYSTGISYSAFGGLTQEQFGTTTQLYNKRHYNVRGQLYDIRLSTLSLQANEFDWNRGCVALYYGGYGWGESGPSNNGNVTAQQHWVPANESYSNYWYTQDSYNYDSLNRLSWTGEVHGGPWGQSSQDYAQVYNYDRFGNRTVDQSGTWGAGIPKPNFGVETNTNRLTAPAGYAMSYDQVGNLTNDTYTGEGTRTFDAENRMVGAQASLPASYAYDGNGQRIKRNVNGTETWQVYGLGGELVAEYAVNGLPANPQKEYGYRNGELLITAASGADVRWLVTDQLGTPRMVVDQSGSLANVSRHDYLPFGEDMPANFRTGIPGYATGDNVRQKFTGYEADTETGLNFAQARYQSATQGRFSSPDPFGGSMSAGDPQSFNRYAYVENNPLTYTDPTGLTMTEGQRGFLPGADGALGRVRPGEGSGSSQSHWEDLTIHTVSEAEVDALYVSLNLIFDSTSNYTKAEMQAFTDTYVAQAQQNFGNIGIQFCVSQTVGTASNTSNEDTHEISSGELKGAINVFVTRGNVSNVHVPEVTNYAKGEVWLSTTARGANSSQLSHGLIHALGIAGGANGYTTIPRGDRIQILAGEIRRQLTGRSAESAATAVETHLRRLSTGYYEAHPPEGEAD